MSETRQMKVYAKYAPKDKGYRPQIKMEGLCLKAAGFEPGDGFTVVMEPGRLVLENRRPASA